MVLESKYRLGKLSLFDVVREREREMLCDVKLCYNKVLKRPVQQVGFKPIQETYEAKPYINVILPKSGIRKKN